MKKEIQRNGGYFDGGGPCIINEKLFTTQILFHQTSRQGILDGEMDGCQETLQFGSTEVGGLSEIPPSSLNDTLTNYRSTVEL